MKQKRKFEGVLATPIKWSGPLTKTPDRTTLGGEHTPDEIAEQAAKYNAAMAKAFGEMMQKLPLLFRHYGIDTGNILNDGYCLFFRLIEDVCPGFRIDYGLPKRGRTRRWDAVTYTTLLADVARLKSRKERTDAQACRDLVKEARRTKTGPYLPKPGISEDRAAASLEARLSEARSPSFNPIMEFIEARAKILSGGMEEALRHIGELWGTSKSPQ